MLRLLPLLLFLAPDAPGGEGKPTDPPGDTPPKDTKPPAPSEADKELAELRKFKADKEAADKAAAEEAAKKNGEWEKLHLTEKQRADAAESRLAELEKKEKARLKVLSGENEEALKALPQEVRDLAPPEADPETMALWLKRASKLANTERPAGGTPPRDSGSLFKKYGLTADEKKEAEKRGVSEEKWFDILVKAGRKKLPSEGK